MAAINRQSQELVHTSNLFRNVRQADLAARLVERAGAGRVFFCNSGAETNEALLKLARLRGAAKFRGEEGRCFQVICARRAFHGRTFGGMSATPRKKAQEGFSPLTPGFVFAELNDLASFEARVTDQTAAVLVETIQGEGGVHPCSIPFLRGLRDLCHRRGLLLMLDEVQCGTGRTGRFFAFEEAGIQPDAIGMAKGSGGGFPIGAIWVHEAWTELFKPGSHGTTFGGSPLACAAALCVLEVMERDKLLECVVRLGVPWRAALDAMAAEYPDMIREVRGRGFMLGIQLAGEAAGFVAALRAAGLLVPAAGPDVVRLLPPLTASGAELVESTEIIRSVARSLHRGR